MIEDSSDDGFGGYKPGSGKLAAALLERVEEDEWTKSDLKAAKRLRLRRRVLSWLKRVLEFLVATPRA